MKPKVVFIFLLAFIAVGSVAYGQANRMRERPQAPRAQMGSTAGGQFYLNMRERLGLTDDQVKKLQDVRLNNVKQVSDLESQLRVARLELSYLRANNGKQSDIEQKIRQVYDLEGSLAVEQSQARAQARSVLTADQLKLLESSPRQQQPPAQGQQPQAPQRRGMNAPGMRGAPM